MFCIKTAIKNHFRYKHAQKLSNDWLIWQLMKHFKADENGHQAKVSEADLGYGWIHYGLIRQQKPKNLLCIGSRYGFIPAVMAQACKDNQFGKVDFVDAGYGANDPNHWTGQAYWQKDEGLNCFKNFGLQKYIQLFVETTAQFAKHSQNNKYDYIYLDGNHSYQGVKFDFQSFWPKLNQGGLLLFHDVCVQGKLPEGEYGVGQLFKEIINKKQQAHLIINYQPSGLGILQKL
jgi:predicted O-methyltransferase YrrM